MDGCNPLMSKVKGLVMNMVDSRLPLVGVATSARSRP
jgi:hypothetical protein